jgi:hypothetical protein
VLLEPPRPHVSGQRPAPRLVLTRPLIRRAAAGAAVVLLAGSIGDLIIVAVLLAVAGLDVAPALVAVLAAGATVLRVGSSSLSALAGAQAVLGLGGVVGPVRSAASAWLAAGALILGAPGGVQAVPFGVAAASFVAGPAPRTGADVVWRVGAALAGGALAWASGRWLPPWLMWPAAALGAGAVALVTVRRHSATAPALGGIERGAAVAVAAGLVVVVVHLAGRRLLTSR